MNSINVNAADRNGQYCAHKNYYLFIVVDRIAVVTNKCHRDVNKDKCVRLVDALCFLSMPIVVACTAFAMKASQLDAF